MAEDAELKEKLTDKSILFDYDVAILTPEEISINWYYFPFGPRKRVKLEDIVSVEMRTIEEIGFWNLKTWGMGIDMSVWWHCDTERHLSRKNAIIINQGHYPDIGITMNDHQLLQLYTLLRKCLNDANNRS